MSFLRGLDSLIGAIDYLESNASSSLFLVGHRDRFGGPKSDQDRLYKILKEYYQSRIDLLQVRVGQKLLKEDQEKPPSQEKTFRSRSFLFIVLGMYAARAIASQIPLLMPEKGQSLSMFPLHHRAVVRVVQGLPIRFLEHFARNFQEIGDRKQTMQPS